MIFLVPVTLVMQNFWGDAMRHEFQRVMVHEEPGDDQREASPCSIIRPTTTRGRGAVATIAGFNQDELFMGQGKEFIEVSFQRGRCRSG